MPPVMQARVSLFPPLPLMPLLEIGFNFLFPICADGCRAGCLPHPADRFADHMVIDCHALRIILEPHRPVCPDAEAPCCASIGAEWKEQIEADFQKRHHR